MKRAMAKQAESERERRAVIIRADGELSAAENLKKAMEQLSASGAISLRTLQTIEATTANPASTIIFALPIEVIEGFKKMSSK
jgi:regulator of protease activity HflC (stomatin/prohibitin superfamily)